MLGSRGFDLGIELASCCACDVKRYYRLICVLCFFMCEMVSFLEVSYSSLCFK